MSRPPAPRGAAQRLMWCLATGFGLGLSPWAPGTFGTLAGLPLVALVFALPGWPWRVAVLAVLALAAIPVAAWGERFFGAKDPHAVVIDEIVSLPITAAFAPPSAVYLVLAFLVNRALDVLKPFPARRSQRLAGGWGIVVDDLISGLYAGLAMLAIHRYADEFLQSHLPAWTTQPLLGAPGP